MYGCVNNSIGSVKVLASSVSDPDSYCIRIQSCQGIRIRTVPIRKPYPDPGEQKGLIEVGKNLDISCFEMLDVLF
jgi:hypothetical protein